MSTKRARRIVGTTLVAIVLVVTLIPAEITVADSPVVRKTFDQRQICDSRAVDNNCYRIVESFSFDRQGFVDIEVAEDGSIWFGGAIGASHCGAFGCPLGILRFTNHGEWEEYGVPQGLSPAVFDLAVEGSWVAAVTQRMSWINTPGSVGGIGFFDGKEWRVFHKDNTPLLEGLDLQSLTFYRGKIFVGGDGNLQGVLEIDPLTGSVVVHQFLTTWAFVQTLTSDEDNLYVGFSQGAGAWKYDGDSWTPVEGLTDERVYTIALGDEEGIWFGTSHGVRFLGHNGESVFYDSALADSPLYDKRIRDIKIRRGQDGLEVWIATSGKEMSSEGGIIVLFPQQNQWAQIGKGWLYSIGLADEEWWQGGWNLGRGEFQCSVYLPALFSSR